MPPDKHSRTPETPGSTPYQQAQVAQHYETLAETEGLREREEKVVGRYFRPEGGRVLDIGCGAGRTTRALTDRGFDVIGIDISEEMVERANRLFDDLDIRTGTATDLEFPDDSFDFVLFSWVGIDSIRPPWLRRQALHEIRRVLKPGGVFAFSSHNSWYTLPAIVVDHNHLRNWYLENDNTKNIGSRYKYDGTDFGVKKYISNPLHQRRQLRRHGFIHIQYVGKRDTVGKYFERQPYYVARKPL
ncbi:class I SAM-dependent methyltransferase [Natrialbaceae archaeon A-CW2]|uniref:class I SAM-dependent methyltransferase n=1 Tax=Natronosalvus amylolyticus TaxID=2961994 RepID=UPI0020CA206B|nr:class I SAM-dependent methyltransferase [Natronosalvus amylolyticus]